MVGAISAGMGAALPGGWPAAPCPGELDRAPHRDAGGENGGKEGKKIIISPSKAIGGEQGLKFPTALIKILLRVSPRVPPDRP